jgi:hypothetical protein
MMKLRSATAFAIALVLATCASSIMAADLNENTLNEGVFQIDAYFESIIADIKEQ